MIVLSADYTNAIDHEMGKIIASVPDVLLGIAKGLTQIVPPNSNVLYKGRKFDALSGRGY